MSRRGIRPQLRWRQLSGRLRPVTDEQPRPVEPFDTLLAPGSVNMLIDIELQMRAAQATRQLASNGAYHWPAPLLKELVS